MMKDDTDQGKWQKLIDALEIDPHLSKEASDRIQAYADAAHDLAHKFMDNASENGVQCDQMSSFILGIMRLGYLRGLVGEATAGDAPEIETTHHEGQRIMGHDELSRLLEDCDLSSL